VEAQRCAKLTGTNSSIGLIVLINPCPRMTRGGTIGHQKSKPKFTRMSFVDLVVIAKGSEPDPIPNSTVKSFCADGTKSQGLGE
jgi:hypothetical protein